VIQMRTQNNKYWKDRAEKRMDFAMLKAEDISEKIGRAYVRALQDMREQIDNIYRNFSAGLSQAEAKRLLRNIKSDSILKKLKKAVDKIEDEKLKAKVIAQLNAPAYRARMERLKRLAENAKQVCENIAGQSVTLMDKGFADIVKNTYYHSIFDTQQGTGLAFSFSKISENVVREVLRTNWSGKHYSSRIWDNTDKLASVLEDELLTGVLTGRSSRQMANSIQDIMHSSYSRTLTLVRTEASFVSNQAELESYDEMGIDKYRYAATLDLRTSEICQSLDGKEFPVAEAQAGENYPPMHPRCRSTTVSVIDGVCCDKLERSARDPKTGKIIKVPQNMTYEEWYEKYVDKSKKSDIIKIEEVKPLEQAKKRDHKIYITDVAVDKVSKVDIPILYDEQNKRIFENHKELLRISKNKNDSNEVALLFDLNSDETTVKLGDEHEVNIFLNPNAVSMADHSDLNSLFLAHNHPSTQDFSYSDLGVFLMNDSIGGISVVSNMGDVHILFKSESYDFDRAYEYISSIRAKYSDYDAEVDKAIVKEFLKNSKKIGVMQY